MSLGEMLVVVLVAIMVMKPSDIPVILDKIRQLKSYFLNTKEEVISYINKEIEINDKDIVEDISEINFYLEKIISINGHYDGTYDLEKLKTKHQELIKDKIEQKKLELED